MVVLALLIGLVAGLRTMTAPAALVWGIALGWVPLVAPWTTFLTHRLALWLLSFAALAEYVVDQLPFTPSRKTPPQFVARLLSGAFCGAVIGTTGGSALLGLIAGTIGAVIGTLGGAAARKRLAEAIGKDRPIAFLEDAVAIGLGLLTVASIT